MRLGIGKDRAAAALAVLRDAGLLVRVATSAGRSARFVAHCYEIRLPVSCAADAVQTAGRSGEVRRVARDGARLFDSSHEGRLRDDKRSRLALITCLGDRSWLRRAFVETVGSLTFDAVGDEFNGLVHRGIADAGHGLVRFLVTFPSTPKGGNGMLNVARLGAGQERYYLDSVASGVEDDYLGNGKEPGQWPGRTSRLLDLNVVVDADLLQRVLEGHDRTTRVRFARAPMTGAGWAGREP